MASSIITSANPSVYQCVQSIKEKNLFPQEITTVNNFYETEKEEKSKKIFLKNTIEKLRLSIFKQALNLFGENDQELNVSNNKDIGTLLFATGRLKKDYELDAKKIKDDDNQNLLAEIEKKIKKIEEIIKNIKKAKEEKRPYIDNENVEFLKQAICDDGIKRYSQKKIKLAWKKHKDLLNTKDKNKWGYKVLRYEGTDPHIHGREYWFGNGEILLCPNRLKKICGPKGNFKQVAYVEDPKSLSPVELKSAKYARFGENLGLEFIKTPPPDSSNQDDHYLKGLGSCIRQQQVDDNLLITRNVGEDLRKIIESGEKLLSANAFKPLAKDIKTLFVKGAGLIDIKPENMGLDKQGVVRLFDICLFTEKSKSIAFTKAYTTTKMINILRKNPENQEAYVMVQDKYAFVLSMIEATTREKKFAEAITANHGSCIQSVEYMTDKSKCKRRVQRKYNVIINRPC